jgi:hypothetical protein
MQDDGNLVLYRIDPWKALWSTETNGTPTRSAVMQGDGNFVCYSPSGSAYWASGTDGHPGANVTLQDDGNLVVYAPTGTALWDSETVTDLDPMHAETGNIHLDTARWMSSSARVSANGLISGHTRIWTTWAARGFHGSVFPVLLDTNQKVIWPEDPQQQKHQYGVDGTGSRWLPVPHGPSDRTDYWTNTVDPAVVARAHALDCIQYLDPKDMLLTDLPIIAKTVEEVIALIAALS